MTYMTAPVQASDTLEMPVEKPDVVSSGEGYAKRFAGPTGQYLLARQTELTMRLVRPEAGLATLDVGGGHAQLVGPLTKAGCDVTIVGSDPACRELPDQAVGPDAYTFVASDLCRLPFGDAAFDVVFGYRLMAHLSDARRFIRELCRVARDRVVIDFTSWGSMNAMAPVLFGVKHGIEKDTRHFRIYTPAHVREMFSSCGFTVAESGGQFMWPMAMHRLLKRPGLSRVLEAPFRIGGLVDALGSPRIVVAKRTDARD